MQKAFTIRTVRTASGATAVQVIQHANNKRVVVKHIGSAHTDDELAALRSKAEHMCEQLSPQFSLFASIEPPSGTDSIYKNNESFAIVFDTIPRQLLALIVSLLTGTLINDFFISKSKIIFGGQYLWARIIGSTMVGEAVLQVVGGVIGFSDTLNFYHQLLPNMILAYGYKMLWNAATVPLIYLLSSYLKKLEGIDTFDYNVNYNPFKLSVAS